MMVNITKPIVAFAIKTSNLGNCAANNVCRSDLDKDDWSRMRILVVVMKKIDGFEIGCA